MGKTVNNIFSNEDTLTLHSDNIPFELSLRISRFDDDKEFVRFIKSTERLVRSSLEYKYWIRYIVDALGQTKCCLSHEEVQQCKIEIHHHPISLFTICKAVITKDLDDQKEFCSFDIATKVIELHFKNKVGYAPLLSSLHEKYHNGYLELPIELVRGDYRYILNNYQLEDEELEKIYALAAIHVKDCEQTWSKDDYPGVKELYQMAVGE